MGQDVLYYSMPMIEMMTSKVWKSAGVDKSTWSGVASVPINIRAGKGKVADDGGPFYPQFQNHIPVLLVAER